ncbi:MAG: choice-of-anchor Q domain-containing protein, partial [Lentisphaerota bacterium]
ADSSGGGAFVDAGAQLLDCIVTGNRGSYGAGVFCASSRVDHCVLRGNQAVLSPGSGGGIYCARGATASQLTMISNTASYGGGSFVEADGVLCNSTSAYNRAGQLGGGAFFATHGLVAKCHFHHNYSTQFGGAAYGWLGGVLRNCLANTNGALEGGGACLDRGGELESCTLAANYALVRGGGVTALDGGEVRNSIVRMNSAPEGGDHIETGTNTWYQYTCTQPTPSRGAYNTASSPSFQSSGAQDYRLRSSSICLNTGGNEGWMPFSTDLDGRPRIYVNRVDMGAYEYNPPDVEVDTDLDGMPDWWEWAYFQHVTNEPAGDDSDADGYAALEEWIIGTDPTNSQSAFYVAHRPVQPGRCLTIEWPSVAGRSYSVVRVTNLLSQGSAELLADHQPATPPMNVHTDMAPLAVRSYYKIFVYK